MGGHHRAEDDPDHEIEIVQRDRRLRGDDSAYWRCSCGETAGGRWYFSVEEALKAAERHVRRHQDWGRGTVSAPGRDERPRSQT